MTLNSKSAIVSVSGEMEIQSVSEPSPSSSAAETGIDIRALDSSPNSVKLAASTSPRTLGSNEM